jgi:hypothetical protein
MQDLFLTNYTDKTFLDKIKESFNKCDTFSLSVSFIKKAGLVLIEREIEESNAFIFYLIYQNVII